MADHPFEGISEKLKRSNENVLNLETEIQTFFRESKYPVFPDPKDKVWQEALDYHRLLKIPLRFSVLAGEVIHHLRSCLDHIVWHFSSASARRDHQNLLEFPIYREPLTKKTLSRYEGKVQGIANPNVRALIEKLQPYHRGAEAVNDPLCIIHDLDRFDKHRELVIVTASAQIQFPAGTRVELFEKALAYTQGEVIPKDVLAAIGTHIRKHHNVTPDVAFAQFGNWKTQPVVSSLAHLISSTSDVVDIFAAEL